VAIDGGATGEFELAPQMEGAAPLQEGFLDGLAVGVAADAAATLMMRGINGVLGGSEQSPGSFVHVRSLGGEKSAPTDANSWREACLFG
jgi:hypothetical protein